MSLVFNDPEKSAVNGNYFAVLAAAKC